MSPADCPIVEEIGSQAFARRLRREGRRQPDRVPYSASMDWTDRCNLRCRHCFIRSAGAGQHDLPTAQMRRVLDKLAGGGVLFLVITGGEPLLRPDFRELYRHTKRLGLVPTLFTNATLVDDDLADFLAEWPPRRIEVTLYGAGARTCARVTGRAGAFRRCRLGIARLLRRGLLVRLKAMLLRSNFHEFDEMRRWAQDQGCEFRYDAIIHPRLNRDRAVLVERLDPATVINLQFRNAGDRQVYREYYRRVRRMPPQQKLFECGAGSKILHVDSRGRAHPCLLWRADPYDLLTGALDDGWRRHLAAILGRPAPPGDCAGCPERGLCNYCPPLGFLETGQPGRKVAYYCALAAARQRRLAAMARDNFASNLG